MTWVGTSWKMNRLLAGARSYAAALRDHDWSAVRRAGVQPFVVPPATALDTVRTTLGSATPVLLGAQDAHWEDAGAWTGELSVPQVADAGARLVELGHSERREHFAETDRTVNLKVHAVLRHGLRPLVCVGEPDEVRGRGGGVDHVVAQAVAALDGVPADRRAHVLLAYEPVWAIGEHGRPARPEDVAPVVAALADLHPGPVLYGGSVSPANAAALLDVPHVDGLFVGRAAWEPEGLLALLELAAGRTA